MKFYIKLFEKQNKTENIYRWLIQISLQSSPLLVDGAIRENGSDMGPP